MPLRTAKAGRAIIGFTGMFVVGRNAGASKLRGRAYPSDNRFSILLRRPRRRAGVTVFNAFT